MSFICERLCEEDREYIQSFQFKNPFTGADELNKIPRYWVVDKEKKYYLICLGGQGFTLNEEYPPYYYELIIDNSAIHVEARFGSVGDRKIGFTMTWHIESIIIPATLEYMSSEKVICIIKEALEEYGNDYKGGHVISTLFKRISVPICCGNVR